MDVVQPGEHTHNASHSIECITSLLDTITCLEIKDFDGFSMFDWSIIIKTIACMFEVLVVAINRQNIDTISTNGLSSFEPHLLRLRLRMGDLSATKVNTGNPPDMFHLFHSVLGVIIEKYNAMTNDASLMADHGNNSPGRHPCLVSLCPIMNGSVQNTPYWSALNDNGWELW
jgi:hypothetical protein